MRCVGMLVLRNLDGPFVSNRQMDEVSTDSSNRRFLLCCDRYRCQRPRLNSARLFYVVQSLHLRRRHDIAAFLERMCRYRSWGIRGSLGDDEHGWKFRFIHYQFGIPVFARVDRLTLALLLPSVGVKCLCHRDVVRHKSDKASQCRVNAGNEMTSRDGSLK